MPKIKFNKSLFAIEEDLGLLEFDLMEEKHSYIDTLNLIEGLDNLINEMLSIKQNLILRTIKANEKKKKVSKGK